MTQLAFGQVAPISRRAVAYIIDAAIATGLSIVLGGGLMIAASITGSLEGTLTTLMIGGPIVSLILLGWFVVYTLMQSRNGSIGMRAQGLSLASAADGAPLGFGRALLRNVIFGLAASIVVGYFTPLFDGSGRYQGWHDKVAKSVMLDARSTSSPSAWMTGPAVVPQRPGRAPEGTAPLPGFPAPATASVPPAFPSGLATNPAPAGTASPTGMPAAPASPAAPHPAPASAPRPVVPAAPVPEAGALIAFVPGVTQESPPPRVAPAAPAADIQPVPTHAPPAPAPAAPVAPAASSPVAPAAVQTPEPEDDAELENTRISVPGHRLIFTWDDGTRVSVSRRTIFGRNPAPEDGAAVVSVRDETLSLSKTHFEAAAETSGGWVLDRHSTNGMTIVRDGQRIACPAGQRVPVRLGDAIEIGDRIVTIGGYA
ncbi:RDD family protein [Microbacterium aurantiacum]|uniref:RDD family protein n=1 Tax=Microbacterium aurantiacum TaxID=162393 RepID=UPI000C7FB308|nr:RDD family protein [Microbacterium aurantiacum]